MSCVDGAAPFSDFGASTTASVLINNEASPIVSCNAYSILLFELNYFFSLTYILVGGGMDEMDFSKNKTMLN
ncbi:unnamed protein product [Rotaria sp. Silwood2]|nr:unnamed protein product [Rotaria sp. Silwood2]CAF4193998.1 unnamed protein product [Rotaria sp. Silwood2]CAF4411070.1 unnamed protein product [Rotaria sp. Silwood2]CAF4538836.1 unnamed protein product [Rotaria sp. Silwood2]